MISDETRAYYDLKKRNDVRESAKRLRRQFLRYKDAEIVYSLQHKKLLELASEAGAIYRMAGEDFEPVAPDELGLMGTTQTESGAVVTNTAATTEEEYTVIEEPKKELTYEERLNNAMMVPCPISKYNGKTLGEVLREDPKALKWVAEKFTGSEEIKAAAQLICEYALQQASA